MVEIEVALQERSYPIQIQHQALAAIGTFISERQLAKKALVISDTNVAAYYGNQVLDSLKKANIAATLYTLPAGESSKSLLMADKIYEQAIMAGLDRHSAIIALGGGVVGDISGFIAATYLRGISFIQIPTTLLAQVDSSVGGKVAVNHRLGKNLVGAFYQPKLVFIDTAVLQTLPPREWRAGMAEVIKYGALGDQDFLAKLYQQAAALESGDPTVLAEVIAHCCKMKADIVAQDETETSLRMLLNFGHTFAHAIEAAGQWQTYNHGEAVAIGMHGAALLSQQLNLCSPQAVKELKQLLLRYQLPLVAQGMTADDILPFLQRDKKVLNGAIQWILLTKLGETQINSEVPWTLVETSAGLITAP